MALGQPLYLDGNDDLCRKQLTRLNTTSGVTEPATGLTGLEFRISLTDDGAAVHASLEQAAAEIGTSGEYFATLAGADIEAHLTAHVGRTVYEIFGDGASVNIVTARRVLRPRRG